MKRLIKSKQTGVSHLLYNLLLMEIEGFNSLAEFTLDVGCQTRGAFQCRAINCDFPAVAASIRSRGMP